MLPSNFVRLGARHRDRVDESLPAQQRRVERRRERARRRVVHRPSCRDDAADADLDQRLRDARRKRGAIEHAVAAARAAAIAAPRRARWQQLTNTSSGTTRIALISLAPRNVSFDSTTPPRLAVLAHRLAVPGDVDDAPAAFEQRVDDRRARRDPLASGVSANRLLTLPRLECRSVDVSRL